MKIVLILVLSSSLEATMEDVVDRGFEDEKEMNEGFDVGCEESSFGLKGID